LTPDITSTVVVDFADGRFSVPRHWQGYPCMRAISYDGPVRRVALTLEETRKAISGEMQQITIWGAIRSAIRGGR
jgi:hypothetical protein